MVRVYARLEVSEASWMSLVLRFMKPSVEGWFWTGAWSGGANHVKKHSLLCWGTV